jgi:hypothetical protein
VPPLFVAKADCPSLEVSTEDLQVRYVNVNLSCYLSYLIVISIKSSDASDDCAFAGLSSPWGAGFSEIVVVPMMARAGAKSRISTIPEGDLLSLLTQSVRVSARLPQKSWPCAHSNLQGLWIRAYGRVKQRI